MTTQRIGAGKALANIAKTDPATQAALRRTQSRMSAIQTAFNEAAQQWEAEHGIQFPGNYDDLLTEAVRAGIDPNVMLRSDISIADILRVIEGYSKRRLDEQHNKQPTAQPAKRRKRQWLAEAMLLVQDCPDLSDAKIATEVRVSPSTLSRSDFYQKAANEARHRPHDKGFIKVDADTGKHEPDAYAEGTDPADMDWDD